MRPRHVGMDSLQALVKQRLLEGSTTCNLKFGEHCFLNKETKVKFDTAIHHTGGLLDCIHINIWDPTKTASLEGHRYYVSFVDNYFRHCWVYPMIQIFEVLGLFVKWKKLMEIIRVRRSRCSNLIILERIKISSCNLVKIMVQRCTSQLENTGLLRR